MILGKVVGTVWATRKDEELVGMKFQIVKHVDLDYKVKDTFVVAVDTVQAGVGDTVLVLDEGNGARQVLAKEVAPIRTVIVGIVDAVTLDTSAA